MRNSNLLPVNANGRGAVAVGRVLRDSAAEMSHADASARRLLCGRYSPSRRRMDWMMALQLARRGRSEMMAGGASCAPSRWSLPALATDDAQQLLIVRRPPSMNAVRNSRNCADFVRRLARRKADLCRCRWQATSCCACRSRSRPQTAFHAAGRQGYAVSATFFMISIVSWFWSAGDVDVGVDRAPARAARGRPRCASSWTARRASTAPRSRSRIKAATRGRDGADNSGRPAPVPSAGFAPKSVRPLEPQIFALQIKSPYLQGNIPAPGRPAAMTCLRLRVAEQAQDAHGLPADGARWSGAAASFCRALRRSRSRRPSGYRGVSSLMKA